MLLLVSMGPASVFALGVGAISLESSLNQPLDSKIEILGISPEELQGLSVNLAPAEVYDRMGIERSSAQEALQFRVDQTPEGQAFIRVFTTEDFNEPFLNFMIEVNWASGRLLREFTILLDPPTFEEEQAKPVEAPQTGAPPEIEVDIQHRALDKPMEVTTKSEVLAEVPDVAGESLDETVQYGPVKKGENLWKIANRIKPSDLSLQQVILALYKQNPEAFFGNNVSMLKEGSVLRLNDIDAARRIPVDAAIAELARHHQDWLAYKRERSASRAVAAESTGDKLHGEKGISEAEIAATKPAEEPVLKLVTPSAEEVASTGIDSSVAQKLESDLNTAKIELAMANELLEAARQENKELTGRITALEAQLESMNRLVELRDKEMQLTQQTAQSSDVVPQSEPESPQVSLDTGDDGTAAIADETPVQEEEKSIFNDPLTIGTLVGVVILLLTFFYVVTRTRQHDLDTPLFDDEDLYDEKGDVKSEALLKTPSAMESAAAIDVSEPKQEEDEEFIDPISEADVYIAYGKYDKAEELLRPAIEKSPDRHELKLKLLEVFSLAGNKNDFDSHAEELYAALGGDKDNPLWIKATELAAAVSPENQLFSEMVGNDNSVFADASVLSELDKAISSEGGEEALNRLFEDDDQTQQLEKEIVPPSNLTGPAQDSTLSMPSKMSAIEEDKSVSDAVTDDVPSLGMSDLELSQMESIAPDASSEPVVTDRGLTSMMENFDEPEVGVVSSSPSTPADTNIPQDLAEFSTTQDNVEEPDKLATEFVSIGYDESKLAALEDGDSEAAAEQLDSLFEEQIASAIASTANQETATQGIGSEPGLADNLETLPDVTGLSDSDVASVQTIGIDSDAVQVDASELNEILEAPIDTEEEANVVGDLDIPTLAESSEFASLPESSVPESTTGSASLEMSEFGEGEDKLSALDGLPSDMSLTDEHITHVENSEGVEIVIGDDSSEPVSAMIEDGVGPLETLSNEVDDISNSVFGDLDEESVSDVFAEENKSLAMVTVPVDTLISEPGVPHSEIHIEEGTEGEFTFSDFSAADLEPDPTLVEAEGASSEPVSDSDVFAGEGAIESDSIVATLSGMESPSAMTEAPEELSADEVSDIFAEDSKAEQAAAAAEFDDTTMFLLADEVGTKLDLARAYIEMGDKQGAIELLKEVQQEGDDKQRTDAEELLALAD